MLCSCMEKVMKAEPDWGILYFAYDWFSAIRTDMVRKVQYDIFIVVYGSGECHLAFHHYLQSLHRSHLSHFWL